MNNNKQQLLNYVSNLNENIYSISNLPEEVIAVIFAYVSRSPNSFRDNLLQVTEDKAKEFHEKWVLNYGHASVAELATVHLGIEKVSRLFSAILERSNLYISPIEYSQRYQMPKQGDFYIPQELNKNSKLKNKYLTFQNDIYNIYQDLLKLLISHYQKTKPTNENESSYHNRIQKLSFEDARYVLTLSTFTNLGITANARAIENTITNLLSSEYTEVRINGEAIKKEVMSVLPTLVKYANVNDFTIKSKEIIINEINNYKIENNKTKPMALLLDFTGKNNPNPEETALNIILKTMLYEQSNNSISGVSNNIKKKSYNDKISLFNKIIHNFSTYDTPPNSFESIMYKAEFNISESLWHQFLRHRKVNFTWQYPTVDNDYIVPPKIEEANLTNIYNTAMDKSFDMFRLLEKLCPFTAHYTVTNGHYRRVIGEFSLWELYHLINLRMTDQAQWDIKNMMNVLVKQIRGVHPNLIQPALNRLKLSKPL